MLKLSEDAVAQEKWLNAEAHKFIVPEVEPFLSDAGLMDLAYFDGKPVRLVVGSHANRHGLMHLLGNWADSNSLGWKNVSEDDAENVAQGFFALIGSRETVNGYAAGKRLQLAYKQANKTVVLEDRGDYWNVVTVLPTADAKNWGVPSWRGRLTFPLPAASDSAAPATGHPGGVSQSQAQTGQGVVSERCQYKPRAEALQSGDDGDEA